LPVFVIQRNAFIFESSRSWNHGRRQRQVPSRRSAGHDHLAEVEVVLLRISSNPVESAQTIFHGRGRQRNFAEPILHVHDGKAHLQVRERVENRFFLGTGEPAPAMDIHHKHRRLCFLRAIDIELGLVVVGDTVRNVRIDLVVVLNPHHGPFRF
jgi:hypothetical protein